MALVGRVKQHAARAVFDGYGSWAEYSPDAYIFYAGQGFEQPIASDVWPNKVTGDATVQLVMAFPRSAEALAPASFGRWYISES